MTSFSQATKPSAVSTPRTRPSSTRIAVTGVSSRIVTPAVRAPRASACTMSLGLACPSVGRNAAPTTSSTVISGKSSCASFGESRCISSPKAVRGRRLPLHLGPALGVAGEPQAAVPLPAGRESGLGLQPVVERDRIAEELRDVGVGAELPDEPGRMPGRAGGELGALQQQHVAQAHLAEMIGDRAADDAAADDHDLRR